MKKKIIKNINFLILFEFIKNKYFNFLDNIL